VVGPATAVQERVAEVSAIVHESVDGALVVKTLGQESAEAARLGAAAERLRAARVRFGNMRAVFEPLLDAVPTLGSIILLVIGAWRVSTGTVTAGEVVQALALFQLLAFPMRVLGYFLEELPHSLVASERLDRITAEPLAEPPAMPTPLPPGPLGVEVDGLGLSFDDHVVLRDVNLSIAPGEVVALVGATGSGKSTLAWMIAGLTAPNAGVVRIGGVPIDEIDPEELSDAVAMVFQEAFLFADELRTNIDVEAALEEHRVVSAAQVAQAHEFISALPGGYATLVGERGVTLSGGQRQRTALARALVRRPRVLLLDDATSAVDPVVEEAILTGLRRELDMTALIVAHRLSTIALADRVLFLDDGSIAAEGGHADLLMTVPAYARLVRAYEEQEAQR
jgi:ABC-type multidrug transport system fused ATPase/permease subunit